MKAGQLNRKITIEQFTSSQDDFGYPLQAWVTFATVWAAIEPLSGKEFWEAGKETNEIDTRIRTRYIRNLKPSFRITYGKRTWLIKNILKPKDDHQRINLMCKEQIN